MPYQKVPIRLLVANIYWVLLQPRADRYYRFLSNLPRYFTYIAAFLQVKWVHEYKITSLVMHPNTGLWGSFKSSGHRTASTTGLERTPGGLGTLTTTSRASLNALLSYCKSWKAQCSRPKSLTRHTPYECRITERTVCLHQEQQENFWKHIL